MESDRRRPQLASRTDDMMTTMTTTMMSIYEAGMYPNDYSVPVAILNLVELQMAMNQTHRHRIFKDYL